MRYAWIAMVFGALAFASPVLAQAGAPIQPAPAPTAVGSIPNWSWIILLAVLAVAVLVFVARRRRGP